MFSLIKSVYCSSEVLKTFMFATNGLIYFEKNYKKYTKI